MTTGTVVKSCSHCRRGHHTVCNGRALINRGQEYGFVPCDCAGHRHRPILGDRR